LLPIASERREGLVGQAPAREDRVLAADVEARIVFERTVGGGDGGVVLLDAALHLLEHRRLQGLGRGQHGLHIGVLGGQVRLDLRLDQGRVAQDLLPVVVLHPGVVVDRTRPSCSVRLGIFGATGGTGLDDSGIMLSDLAFSGRITDTDVMTAAALVIILRRFMVSFSP
jgi:hypothetical protein